MSAAGIEFVPFPTRGRYREASWDAHVRCPECRLTRAINVVSVLSDNVWPECGTRGCPDEGFVMAMIEAAETDELLERGRV